MAQILLVAIFISILIGLKFHVNIGPFAMLFALLFGVLGANLSINQIVSYIPINLIFNIVAVTLFYGFARENGALSALVDNLLYRSKSAAQLIPFIIFLLTLLVGALGLGIFAGIFMAPVAFELGRKMKCNPMLIFICICCGALMGSNLPFSLGGVVVRSLMLLNNSTTPKMADDAVLQSSVITAIVCVGMVFIGYLLFRSKVEGVVQASEPHPLDRKQKATLWLVLAVILSTLIPRILQILVHDLWVTKLVALLDFGPVCTVFVCIASALKLADEHTTVMRCIPWNTVILLSGFSCLLAVANELGTMDLISSFLLMSIPRELITPVLALVAGCMSFFASGISVVCPTLFPLVPAIVESTGLPAGTLYAAIFVGSSATGTSPISALGNSVLGCLGDEDARTNLFYKSISVPVIMMAITVIVCFILSVV